MIYSQIGYADNYTMGNTVFSVLLIFAEFYSFPKYIRKILSKHKKLLSTISIADFTYYVNIYLNSSCDF